MSLHRIHSPRRRATLAGLLLALSLGVALSPFAAARDAARAHHVHITRQAPACANPEGMPIIPNDPGALVTSGGTRCHGDGSPAFELWLPEDRYVWLERREDGPAAWIALGPGADPSALETPPLGLRLSASGGTWTLELRHGRNASLARLETGRWQNVAGPDGRELWVRVAGDAPKAALTPAPAAVRAPGSRR